MGMGTNQLKLCIFKNCSFIHYWLGLSVYQAFNSSKHTGYGTFHYCRHE